MNSKIGVGNDDDLAYAKAAIIMLNRPFEYSFIKVVRGRVQLMDSNGSTRILSAGEELRLKGKVTATVVEKAHRICIVVCAWAYRLSLVLAANLLCTIGVFQIPIQKSHFKVECLGWQAAGLLVYIFLVISSS